MCACIYADMNDCMQFTMLMLSPGMYACVYACHYAYARVDIYVRCKMKEGMRLTMLVPSPRMYVCVHVYIQT